MAASAATQEAMWLNRLLQQLGFKTPRPTKIYNKVAILFSDHPGDHRRSKHIDTRSYFVRDAVLHGDIILEYIPTAERLADRLTKPLSVLNIKSYAWITIYIEVYIHIYMIEFNIMQ